MPVELLRKDPSLPLRIGILASHNGTDMRAIAQAIDQGQLNARIAVVVSNNSDASALAFAKEKNIPAKHVSRRTHSDPDRAIKDTLMENGTDLVILCGYMRQVEQKTLQAFHRRIVNIHPSLLPKYARLQDLAVHTNVLEHKEEKTGVTIHMVTDKLDEGEILAQSQISIPKELLDTQRDLQARALQLRSLVQAEEGKLLVKFLQTVA